MTNEKNTSLYVSIPKKLDEWIDQHRIKKIKNDKTQYTKTQIVKNLIEKGRDVENGNYIEIDIDIDEFVSKLRNVVIEKDGEIIRYKKSKKQIYYMLIEKGIEHLNE